MKIPVFQYVRQRGIVWVCDLEQSTSYLNSDANAGALEDFLPRLHAVGKTAVTLAGGDVFKWAGDGFLAWFPLELERTLPNRAGSVFQAIWYLTVLVNISRLGCPDVAPAFKIRHGLTYEPDGLLYRSPEGVEILGRAVSLAFRLASVPAPFPSFVAQARVFNAALQTTDLHLRSEDWAPTDEELLKHFKGQRSGTEDLVRSTAKAPDVPVVVSEAIKTARSVIKKIEDAEYPQTGFAARFIEALLEGPDWSQRAANEFHAWSREAYESLAILVANMEKGPTRN